MNSDDSVLYLALNQSLMNEIPVRLGEDFFVRDLKNDITPLKPFFSIIQDMSLSEKQIKSHFYSLQLTPVKTYLKTGFAEEREDPIFEQEFFYETCRMLDSVVNIVNDYTDKNYIFLNAQFMFEESSIQSILNSHLLQSVPLWTELVTREISFT